MCGSELFVFPDEIHLGLICCNAIYMLCFFLNRHLYEQFEWLKPLAIMEHILFVFMNIMK